MAEDRKTMLDGLEGAGAIAVEQGVGLSEVTHGSGPTAWNYAQAIKAIAVAEVQRDCVFNGIRGILEKKDYFSIPEEIEGCLEAVLDELRHIHHTALATGSAMITQRLAVTLSMILTDNDFGQAGTGIDKEDSDQIKEARKLLELLT